MSSEPAPRARRTLAPPLPTPLAGRRVVRVEVPTHLRAYTRGEALVTVSGAHVATLDDVLRALDRRGPGFRFRVVDERGRLRPHIKVFVDRAPTRDLAQPVRSGAEVFLAAALSGG